ncbi:ABC transporter permease [Pseudofrankia sp. BMG5.36]|uniref:ABC transporter permease n=1 Tax=Pseudofrankia sp. BMG5.36 TaxID=1834512 RepID=UPI0008DA93A0|nr:ABC transporter permease [Pseudofrankia sp. BMG5.36]OHV45553.1 ABC transporter [Pseudofrankia sp. BMG5.36]
MTLLGQLRLLWWRKMLETLRAPVWVVMGLTTPLLYLALFAPLLRRLGGGPGFAHGGVLDTFIPGILVLMAFGSGMGAGWIVIDEVRTGVIERLRVTPVSRFALLLGSVLRDVVTFVVPALVVVVVSIPFGYHPHTAGTVLLLVLLCLVVAVTSAWSAALGITLRDIGSLAAVVTGLQLPLTLLSGILLPLSLAPGWLRGLAHVDPLYYAVQASRHLSAGDVADVAVATGFLVIAALAALTLVWATRCYRAATA